MWKKLTLVSLVLWIVTFSVAGYFFIKGTGKTGDDGRHAVKLNRSERNLVLGEMRQLLSGVQTILEAITNNDLKVVEQTASSLGMKVIQLLTKQIGGQLSFYSSNGSVFEIPFKMEII